MTSRDSKYSLLKDDEPRGSESGYESDGFMPLKTPQRSRVRAWLPWMAQTLIFTSSVFFFTVGTMRFNAVEKVTTFEPVYTQEYPPAVHFAGERHAWELQGEFDQPSPWRGTPSDELDEAWDHITHTGAFSITAEEVERLGKMRNSTVKLPAASGGGYMASSEATHQLHCVDMLRKFTYRDYYAQRVDAFRNPEKLRVHMDHCIEMLRQVIMCNGDLHIITYDWVAHADWPWPDFSVNRQCRSWDNILGWIGSRVVHTKEENGVIFRPEGAPVRDVNPVEYVHLDF